ncbi:sce7726 family protein [Fructilactobacillus fructivorans]|uniref:Sce7726 family protein n=1 Tax=Fructilactobacillus fructivorans TaxID=1614 RepID=A0A0C1LZH5_9LACO|nr:sce7726 family protein [Fructilactobacillus fructivorans]KID42275.1 hypothetical protein LfDm3_0204 [Fructilactobacillus fructivorans]MCT0151104.1 hypothetical protein [Fructilactobacillus fructivorans]MCT2867338.1 hypothetical protein [Fructilactobacillus fructivorans]MCT2869143.1 hypothetical protein [Fructilactobacillus fructivorans]MCT2873137.1 hypothetical protein [Fructilactobacillus fructivorans]
MNMDKSLNKLFTIKSLNNLIYERNVDNYKKIVNKLNGKPNEMLNLQNLKLIYKYMSVHHRNEYFYKNTLLNKILLGRHSINTSTAIRELPIDGNILDFLIVNGTGSVYEIKTELDNLQRLKKQLDAYYRAFSFCNVVTDETHLKEIKRDINIPELGILVLTKRNTLHEEKKAKEKTNHLNHKTMFRILRKYEFENILMNEFGYLPDINSLRYYDECFKMFRHINIFHAQKLMLAQLKRRCNINSNNLGSFNNVPKEIKFIIYFSNYKKNDFNKLNSFLYKKTKEM